MTPSETVATRARKAIPLGPGSSVTPFVVGPSAVPFVSDVAEAKRDPELAVLSAMAHGDAAPDVAVPIATAALAAAAGLEDERALLYSDLVRISLGEAARRAFEKIMANGNYEFQSDFHKKADRRWPARSAVTHSLMLVLESRGIALTTGQKEHVLACTDPAVLEGWIRKAATASSADELFAD